MMIWMTLACAVQPEGSALSSMNSSSTERFVPPIPPIKGGSRPLVARVAADVSDGTYPLVVSFDATQSDLGSGLVDYRWSFGDGTHGAGSAPSHVYLGQGSFEATLTLVEKTTGVVSVADVVIEVEAPACPVEASPVDWGHVDDPELNELSGIVISRLDPAAWWVHEDSGNVSSLVSINMWGNTLSTQELPGDWSDFEDIASAVDPATGISWLFLGDIGDNGYSRDEISVWAAEEPDPRLDGTLTAMEMELTYPDGPHNAETLLVDPLTLDLYIVTKDYDGDAELYVKRAPHDSAGLFVLEDLGDLPTQLVATGGDISADGTRVVLRDYSDRAFVWNRDGYLPLEDALMQTPCEIDIAAERQGEAVGFTADGLGVVTVSEGSEQLLHYIEL
jgi:PKD repeat protein